MPCCPAASDTSSAGPHSGVIIYSRSRDFRRGILRQAGIHNRVEVAVEDAMVEAIEKFDLRTAPLVPMNPLPYWQQMKAIRAYHSGPETLRDAGGAVTRLRLAPNW